MDGNATSRAGRGLRVGLLGATAWVVSWVVVGWVMMARVVAEGPRTEDLVEPGDWVGPLLVVSMVILGVLVLGRDRSHPYGWLLVGAAIVVAPATAAGLYALDALALPGADPPLAVAAGWVQDLLTWPWMATTVLLLPSLFPDGRAVNGRWGAALRVVLAGWVVWTVTFMFIARPLEGWLLAAPEAPENPVGVLPISLDLMSGTWVLLMLASAGVSVGSIRRRWRTADDIVRRQITWPLVAFVVLGFLLVAEMIDEVLVHGLGVDLGMGPAIGLAGSMARVLLMIGVGLGVLRHRLYDVDRVVNRTVVYGTMTTVVFAVYLLLVLGVGALAPGADGRGLSLAATALVAVLFEPLRRRLQTVVNRAMFGQRDEPYAVLKQLGERVTRAGSPADTLELVVDTLYGSLKLSWVCVDLYDRDGQVFHCERGVPPSDESRVAALPLVHADRRFGRLLAAARGTEELTPPDRRLLGDVARQAGALAASVLLTLELQRSREQLVLAREEERRRIRRDLHDGLGPSLAAQTLALDALADRVEHDPSGARELAVTLKRDTQDLVAEIRRLVHELRPPALDELGLAGALVAEVARLDGTGQVAFRVRTEPDPLPDLPAGVEVAAWQIVREALTNVVRHAEAVSCDVVVAVDDDVLRIRVADDGVGLPVVPRPGVGTSSMRERAEELGGSCVVAAAPGHGTGTLVTAALPLGGAAQTHEAAVPEVSVDG